MYGVRRELEVDSIETKITKRSLQRIGHVLRMDNSRLAKQVTLGWPLTESQPENEIKPQLISGERS